MDRILIIMKKNNGHQGIICPFTGAFFHNMQTCLLVYTYNRSQVSVYRTIGPLVIQFFFILASNKDIHNISDELEFQPDPTSDAELAAL